MKIIGAILMLVGAAASGMLSVMRLRKHAMFLSELTDSLEMMKNEICMSLSPIGDVLEELSSRAPEGVRDIYTLAHEGMSRVGEMLFCDIWSDAVNKACENILTKDETEALSYLGMSLGRYDIQWQADAINRTIRKFERFTAEAEAVRDRDSKAHALLSLAGGLFAVIVLI